MRRIRHDGDNQPPRHPQQWGGGGTDDPDDRDWDLSEGLDPEGPSAEDLHTFGNELDTCPNCKSTIYDQSEMCPQCGWYLGEVEKTVSLWVIFGVCGLIIMMLFWVF
ncbi:MAG: hypothetical protein ACF8MF_12545 [Phycisphaerales bacterium JB052]